MRNAPFFLGNHHDIIYFKRDHSATAVTSDLVIESSSAFYTYLYLLKPFRSIRTHFSPME